MKLNTWAKPSRLHSLFSPKQKKEIELKQLPKSYPNTKTRNFQMELDTILKFRNFQTEHKKIITILTETCNWNLLHYLS